MKTTIANQPLADLLDQHTAVGAAALWRAEGDRIRCLACGHRCLIGQDQRGICKVRFNNDGELKVPFGYIAGLQCDPVEKKPFFHVYPSSDALTFGMMGCDLHCSYCQNWLTSQALRDTSAVAPVRTVTASELVAVGRRERARLVVSSYNEPLITAEWAVAVFREARAAGLDCAFVSNGNATPEVLDFLRPWIVAYKVDLKCFSDRNYRKLGGLLENITSTIGMVHERGIWLEVVTLVVPGFNDSPEELRQIARFLVSVSPDIPWHITAFHKDYRMTDPDPTGADTLLRAAEIGAEEGLRFIYAGNLPGRVNHWENTRCPSCQTTLIERTGYLVRSYRLTADGCCSKCQAKLPGIWPRQGVAGQPSGIRLPRPVAVNGGQLAVDRINNSAPAATRQDRRQGLPVVKPQADNGFQNLPNLPRGESPTMSAPSTMPRPPSTTQVPPGIRRPTLSDEHKQQVIGGVAGLLRNLVLGKPVDNGWWAASPSAGGRQAIAPEVANLTVWGAFVSLKRGKHLRCCSGVMGQSLPLHQAVAHAADRTVWEDERFPPVSPSEVEHLELEVWLLFNPQQVQARGEERARAITLGTHGIQLARGQSGALFLPGVSVENNWDAFTFLDRVCMKAGLPASAWRDDGTTLLTFEGEALRSSIAKIPNPAPVKLNPFAGPCQIGDVPKITALCRVNIFDLLRGAVPHYFASAPDGTVSGAILTVRRQGSEETPSFTRLSLRPGLPLQSTLFGLVQNAAQFLGSQGITVQELEAMPIGLALLHDPVLHGTVADPQLAGFEPRRRAILVMERNKAGLALDRNRSPEEVLREAADQARVSQPQVAAVFSLAAVANMDKLSVSTAPKPVRGPAVRPAAAAGKFYDGDPARLSQTVDHLLAGDRQPGNWLAAMVPHAGLQYSGRIAANVLKSINIPKTVIIIGPNHTGLGMDWAVAPHQTWALPGGSMESDFMLARRLSQAIPGLEMDSAAHQQEHAIEVELPLLARLAPETKVLGITIGQGDLASCRRFAQSLAEVIRGRSEKPLLLISSDMNHFANDAETRRLDALALAALQRRDAAELFEVVTRHNISMCGMLPAVIVLETLKLLGGCSKAVQTGYATTADVTRDTSRVVGYAGMLFG